jgi:integrase
MMGLGSVDLVSLNEARNLAYECRKKLQTSIDPIEAKIQEQQRTELDSMKAMTFDQCADAYIHAHRPSWRNQKHGDQWVNTIRTYVSPIIGKLPVQSVDTNLVMRILEPIWSVKNETASRIRARIELVLAWATVRGYRSGLNPAIWRNHLDKLLPSRARVKKPGHFAALPFTQMNTFMSELREQSGTSARALEFLILTASRTSETLKAKWQEFNFAENIWIIPGERMKAGVEHRVPLSPQVNSILQAMRDIQDGEYVFSSNRKGTFLSNMALLKVIERMGYEVTSHGFRSTFRDWAAERTNFPREVCEQALAHSLRDKVESAYRRGDLLLKRQILMSEWAKFCESPNLGVGDIVSIESRFA